MKRHLSANDYSPENEKVTGYWHGKAAKLLGIEGIAVTKEAFEALRTNRHPLIGDKLRPRDSTVVLPITRSPSHTQLSFRLSSERFNASVVSTMPKSLVPL